jgi:hypothetical protein
MKFGMGPAPSRKRKNVTNELDKHTEYQQLKAVLLNGRLRPHEMAYITMGPDDAKTLGYKWPWRAATDQLRRLIKQMRLEKDYRVVKYQTDASGVWCVRLSYEPPAAVSGSYEDAAEPSRRGRRARKVASVA